MKSINFKKIAELSLLILFVFGFRVLLEEAIPLFEERLNLSFGKFVAKLLGNYPVTLFMIGLDFLIVYLINKYIKEIKPWIKILGWLLTALLVAILSAVYIRFPVWKGESDFLFFSDIYFNLTLLTSFILNLIIISIIEIYLFFIKSHEKALNIEIGKKTRAQYQYQQLKRQLNPHFLFNSLNVLDFLIYSNPDKASEFVRKLSAIYRYQLSFEDCVCVTLEEEIEFVNLYADLLKERFSDGLELTLKVEDKYLGYHIVPGGLQLLVENATKHNIISIESPLKIEIYIEDGFIITRNNVQLRLNTIESGGVGLKNIKGQYKLLFKKNIEIVSGERCFCVKIPLIDR